MDGYNKFFKSVLELDLDISEEQFHKILSYFDLLLEYNRKVNLVSNAPSEELFARHIYDVLIAKKHFGEFKELVDIGSGGGVPGVLLAIMNEKSSVTLVESKQKKVDFLKKLPSLLDLPTLKVERQNAFELKKTFEVISARGFGSIKKIISLTKQMNSKNTEYRLFKGRIQVVYEELEEVKHLIKNVKIISLEDPLGALGERQIARFSLKRLE